MGIFPWVWFLSALTLWCKERQILPRERGWGEEGGKGNISAALLLSVCRGDRAGVPSCWALRQARGLLSWTEVGSRAERAGKPSAQGEGDGEGSWHEKKIVNWIERCSKERFDWGGGDHPPQGRKAGRTGHQKHTLAAPKNPQQSWEKGRDRFFSYNASLLSWFYCIGKAEHTLLYCWSGQLRGSEKWEMGGLMSSWASQEEGNNITVWYLGRIPESYGLVKNKWQQQIGR